MGECGFNCSLCTQNSVEISNKDIARQIYRGAAESKVDEILPEMLKALQCWAVSVDIPTCPLKDSACELADLGSSFHFYKEGHGNSVHGKCSGMDGFV